jgi:hypothetical protein
VGKVTIEMKNVDFDEVYCAEHEEFFPGKYVILAVSDSCSGMGRQVFSKIFLAVFHNQRYGQKYRPGVGHGILPRLNR